MRLQTGKLPSALLEELLSLRGAPDPSVVLGPAIGEDAAVVDLGDQYLVLKTDPVTFTADEIGWYAVHVNANDVATTGAKPRWFQATILLPPGSEAGLAREVFGQVHEACMGLGVAVTGGHTEVTPAVRQPVVVGDMQGVVSKDSLVTTAGAREGDVILLTKVAGIEGTAILAKERADELRLHFDEAFVARAAGFLRSPGISIVREALAAAEAGATSLHDPTEGGVSRGLWELSKASGRELDVDAAAIPVAEETGSLCEFYELNPLSLIASGALLVTIPESKEKVERLLGAYEEMGIGSSVIGRVAGHGVGINVTGEGDYPLEPTERDELSKVLDG